MARLSRRESTLLVFFVLVVFVMAHLLAAGFLRRQWTALREERGALEFELETSRSWIGESEWLAPQMAMLEGRLQSVDNEEAASAELLAESQRLGDQFGISFKNQRVQPAREENGWKVVSIVVDAEGSLESLIRWLTALQRPDRLQGLEDFSLKADKNPSNYVCNIRLSRFFLAGQSDKVQEDL